MEKKKDQNNTCVFKWLYNFYTASSNPDFLEVQGYSSENNLEIGCVTITTSQKSIKALSVG